MTTAIVLGAVPIAILVWDWFLKRKYSRLESELAAEHRRLSAALRDKSCRACQRQGRRQQAPEIGTVKSTGKA